MCPAFVLFCFVLFETLDPEALGVVIELFIVSLFQKPALG